MCMGEGWRSKERVGRPVYPIRLPPGVGFPIWIDPILLKGRQTQDPCFVTLPTCVCAYVCVFWYLIQYTPLLTELYPLCIIKATRNSSGPAFFLLTRLVYCRSILYCRQPNALLFKCTTPFLFSTWIQECCVSLSAKLIIQLLRHSPVSLPLSRWHWHFVYVSGARWQCNVQT